MLTGTSLASASIILVGDVMLDVYLTGTVERISAEAPVPIVRLNRERAVPGGAANVAANIAGVGGRVQLFGVRGEDDAGRRLHSLLTALPGVDHSGLLCVKERPTTSKTRIIGEHQQIVRVDHEDASPLDTASSVQLARAATAAIVPGTLVAVSDYGKGVCTEDLLGTVIEHAHRSNARVIVDPKRRDWSAYRGATLITPNRQELAVATGMPCDNSEQIVSAARLAQRVSGANILVTRSAEGMSFVPLDGAPLHMATAAKEVFDVSGAGDTVVALLSTALASGWTMPDAMEFANRGAGLVVGRLGTAAVSAGDLGYLMSWPHTAATSGPRVLSLEEAVTLRRHWGRDGLRVGVTNGVFDLMHPGHAMLLRKAAESCDRLIVALNSDASVRRLKGSSRPIQSEAARASVMLGMKGVAGCVIFDEDTPLKLIEALRPDTLIKGGDYQEHQIVGADIVRSAGGEVIIVDLEAGHSTSLLVSKSAQKGGVS